MDHGQWVGLYRVFSAAAGGGGLAGVVLDSSGLEVARMQSVAKDLGVPTTGFVAVGSESPEMSDSVRVRFFTPRQEIAACGYVTLAVARALQEQGHWPTDGTAALIAAGGPFRVRLTAHAATIGVRVRGHDVVGDNTRASIATTLGLPLADVPCELVATGLRHLVVPVALDQALSDFTPDFAAAMHVGGLVGADTIALFAESARPSHGRITLRLRDVCAPIGDLEEPASGTTAAAVADFVHRYRGLEQVVIRQGAEMGQPSLLRTKVRARRLIEVTGTARRVLCGRLGSVPN